MPSRKKILIFFGGIMLAQLLFTTLVGLFFTYQVEHDRAPVGLQVWGEDISGKTLPQAVEYLNKLVPEAVSFDGRIFKLTKNKSNEKMETELRQLFLPESTLLEVIGYSSKSNVPKNLLVVEKLDREEIISQLEELRLEVDTPPKPAGIVAAGNELIRQAGQDGRELDIEGTWNALLQASGKQPVPLVVKPLIMHPTNDDIDKIKDSLGDYTTYYDPQNLARSNNIRLASNALNGKLIGPGETFSFNDQVGERSESAGYLPASVYINQQVTQGDGGGVCQDSSTLYQAVLQAHLPVVERYTHSLPVSYVPTGKDATVDYGAKLDFRFRNDTSGYILLSSETGADFLRIRLFGVTDITHQAISKPGSMLPVTSPISGGIK